MRLRSRDRDTIEEAFPGDIVGIWDPGLFRIGDTLFETDPVRYGGIPRFSPELFAQVRTSDPFRRKQLKKGLEQLSEEGAVQLFFDRSRLERDPILGAVGRLQFDVVVHRLKAEYGVEAKLDTLRYKHARWVLGEPEDLDDLASRSDALCVLDLEGRALLLFETDFKLRWAEDNLPDLKLASAVQPARAKLAR